MENVTTYRFKLRNAILGPASLILTLAIMSVSLVSCGSPPAYTVRLDLPLVPADLPEAGRVIGVVDIVDARANAGRLLGKVTDRDGKKRDVILAVDSVPESMTTLLKSILRKNNFIVSDVPAWRPAPDGSPSVPSSVNAVVSARIEELSVEVESFMLKTEIRYRIRIAGEIGIRGYDRVVVQTVTLEPMMTRPGFSQATMERGLNEYLQEAMEKLSAEILAMADT